MKDVAWKHSSGGVHLGYVRDEAWEHKSVWSVCRLGRIEAEWLRDGVYRGEHLCCV